jgi:hypothetical protein
MSVSHETEMRAEIDWYAKQYNLAHSLVAEIYARGYVNGQREMRDALILTGSLAPGAQED